MISKNLKKEFFFGTNLPHTINANFFFPDKMSTKNERSSSPTYENESGNSKVLTFSGLATEYEKILSENRYGSVGWILLHSKIQKCYCRCVGESLCSDGTKREGKKRE